MQEERPGSPVPYMERTKNYYRALGYNNDYVWAHHDDVPFTRPARPVRAMKIGLVTTAGPPDGSARDARGRRLVWSGLTAAPPPAFETDMAWDKESTHTDDSEVFLPLAALKRLVASGEVGAIGPRFHGAPTDYSHAKTTERDAPDICKRLWEDEIDAAILTAL